MMLLVDYILWMLITTLFDGAFDSPFIVLIIVIEAEPVYTQDKLIIQ